MTIQEAIDAAKAGYKVRRSEWVTNAYSMMQSTVIIWNPKRESLCYWYLDAPIPEKYKDDDPRMGAEVTTFRVSDVISNDWEVYDG